MNETIMIICVNDKKEYHDCEMVFSFDYQNETNGFQVDSEQKYKIHTTLEEVKVLNDALHLYQEKGFKEAYWLFTNDINGSVNYPDFKERFEQARTLAKQLQALSKDEDSLVQLSEYCLETPPTYEDDFYINKTIESISVNGATKQIHGYEDLKEYLSNL